MREQLKTRANGVARVLQSAAALRYKHGLWGQAKVYDHAYEYLKKRSRWMRYQSYRRQHLSIGSGGAPMPPAKLSLPSASNAQGWHGRSRADKSPRFPRDLVKWRLEEFQQGYLAAKPMPSTQVAMAQGAQWEQQVASLSWE